MNNQQLLDTWTQALTRTSAPSGYAQLGKFEYGGRPNDEQIKASLQTLLGRQPELGARKFNRRKDVGSYDESGWPSRPWIRAMRRWGDCPQAAWHRAGCERNHGLEMNILAAKKEIVRVNQSSGESL
jgi:hypothetical protein